jgi:hypothetical protein
MGFELERREARKEACVGSFCLGWGSLRRVRVVVNAARFKGDERALREGFCDCWRSWRRVCWRRVRMHDVQTVEVDILGGFVTMRCGGCLGCRGGVGGVSLAPSKFNGVQ